MTDTHQLGTSLQDIGPLDGSGGVLTGVAVKCGACGDIFTIVYDHYQNIVGSSRELPDGEPEVWCPYCGIKLLAKPAHSHFSDTRQRWGDD